MGKHVKHLEAAGFVTQRIYYLSHTPCLGLDFPLSLRGTCMPVEFPGSRLVHVAACCLDTPWLQTETHAELQTLSQALQRTWESRPCYSPLRLQHVITHPLSQRRCHQMLPTCSSFHGSFYLTSNTSKKKWKTARQINKDKALACHLLISKDGAAAMRF